MKQAKKIFALLFLTVYLLYAGSLVLDGNSSVASAIADTFPSREAMHYSAAGISYRLLPYRIPLLEEHARLQVLLNKKENNGLDIIATQDDSYVKGNSADWSSYQMEQYAIQLYTLQESLAETGSDAKVIYISAQPSVIYGYTEPLESFSLPDESAMMQALLYYLRAYDVDFLDTAYVLRRSSLEPSELIYKTDTAWTTQASFAAVQALVGKLDSQYDAGIDPAWHYYNDDNFQRITYPDVMMGTLGMQAGEPYTGREDFTAILPAYETDFSLTLSGFEETTVTGTFDETLYDGQFLNPDDPYLYSAYSAYLDTGAYDRRIIRNETLPDAPKALLIHDRSALPFAAFTALGFSEVHLYWPAQATDDGGFDIAAYAEENDIDYIFFLAECDSSALKDIFQWLPVRS